MKRIIIVAIFGALAVIVGAFGAHGLKPLLTADQLESYKTGVSYQFYHTIVLFGLALLINSNANKYFKLAFTFISIGILLFSGSIYLLSTRDITGLTSMSWLGPITPIGGLSFILGWVFLGIGAYQSRN